jgi:phospholipase/carboxylesterase
VSEVLPCVELEPEGSPLGSIVWLHGLGADGNDFVPIVPMLGMDRVRFVFPHAPAIPVTINSGFVMPAWYDIRSLDAKDDRECTDDIALAAKRIRAVLDREIERGVPPSRIVLAGFSQGAAMALHVGVRFDRPLAGIVALSGYRVAARTMVSEWNDANRATPVFCAHGSNDDLVTLDRGREAYDFVQAHSNSKEIEWHEFAIGHEVSPEEIHVLGQWLAKRFA